MVQILDQLWELGVPHIIFTGGESTFRNDLPELIAHANPMDRSLVSTPMPVVWLMKNIYDN